MKAKQQIEFEIDEIAINDYIEKTVKKKAKEYVDDIVKKIIADDVDKFISEHWDKKHMNEVFDEYVRDAIAGYSGRKVNMLFQDLEDSLFERMKNLERVTLHYDISKEEKAFYEGLYMAFLAQTKNIQNLEDGIINGISERVFEDIQQGRGYKLLAYRLTQAYQKEQRKKSK